MRILSVSALLILLNHGQPVYELGNNSLGIRDSTKYQLKNILNISNENKLSIPRWSPNGNFLLLTSSEFNDLFIYNIYSKSLNKIYEQSSVGYNATWSSDSKYVYFKIKKNPSDFSNDQVVNKINIHTREIFASPEIFPSGFESSVRALEVNDPIVYVNSKTLLIEAFTKDKSKQWLITKNRGQYYQPILSPDKSKVVIHESGNMYVYSIDGELLVSLGKGLASCWSRDSKRMLFVVCKDNGHSIIGCELFLANIIEPSIHQLTNTPDVFEMFPTWSPDDKKICYSDEKSNKIFIADLSTN